MTTPVNPKANPLTPNTPVSAGEALANKLLKDATAKVEETLKKPASKEEEKKVPVETTLKQKAFKTLKIATAVTTGAVALTLATSAAVPTACATTALSGTAVCAAVLPSAVALNTALVTTGSALLAGAYQICTNPQESYQNYQSHGDIYPPAIEESSNYFTYLAGGATLLTTLAAGYLGSRK
ncbi:MAG: hypothetical protein S4CHLAM7_03860 [Chlamydiae bacterium]|nr:hypothetical protein [Chlamydiota bacterium]